MLGLVEPLIRDYLKSLPVHRSLGKCYSRKLYLFNSLLWWVHVGAGVLKLIALPWVNQSVAVV